ncbi:MAG: aspartate aminotransferase family protein [Ilumatobacteraceae bacterium]|nr:aspartate aminotransferase family protein [Ilumatobacteraceae bacterium]
MAFPLLGPGRTLRRIQEELETMRVNDVAWRDGRAFTLTYSAGTDVLEVAQDAYQRFANENALNTDAFPSLGTMAKDVVATVLGWTHAPDTGSGFMTSGGTESLLLAVRAAREGRRNQSKIWSDLNIVLPTSAHAAFEKACSYFDVTSRRVAVTTDWRADVQAMADAVDDKTILLVASAPQYPQGVIDPVAEIAALARASEINCHVDACMGGVTLTYLERLGHDIAPWDFRVDGVTSISVDLHKYGYTSKGAGVLVHRTKELRNDQTFVTDNWLGGTYGSSGILGTKSGGPIASAWAVMHYLGDNGYERVTESARTTALAIANHIDRHPSLVLLAQPDATLLSFTTSDEQLDIFTLADNLRRRGWYLDRQGPPPSLHLTVNAIHNNVMTLFLAHLDEAVSESMSGADASPGTSRGAYGTID